MVPLSVYNFAMKDNGKDIVDTFFLSAESFSDSEDEDNDVLNVSCHGNNFKRMFEPGGCGKLAVKRRKLQTHLETLDLEFLALNFEKSELVNDAVTSGSTSTSPREPATERLRKSPRRQKSSSAANNKSKSSASPQ